MIRLHVSKEDGQKIDGVMRARKLDWWDGHEWKAFVCVRNCQIICCDGKRMHVADFTHTGMTDGEYHFMKVAQRYYYAIPVPDDSRRRFPDMSNVAPETTKSIALGVADGAAAMVGFYARTAVNGRFIKDAYGPKKITTTTLHWVDGDPCKPIVIDNGLWRSIIMPIYVPSIIEALSK